MDRPDAGPDPGHWRLHEAIARWYAAHGRDLPWRRPGTSAWGVLVSEVMSQQTPVARFLPAWTQWLQRWPTPADLAADSPGEAVRAWGRLGYPRRALRLHEAAGTLVRRHGGRVPGTHAELLALPGVGAYTASAVLAFAFGARATVVDTNVRRVQARAVGGRALPASAVNRAETALASALLPPGEPDSVRWNVAVMELGALVCTARAPRCEACPLTRVCAWRRAGYPADQGPPRRGQAWTGTDRQVRGVLLAVLREADGAVRAAEFARAWPGAAAARRRCLQSLVADGLVEPLGPDRFRLPA